MLDTENKNLLMRMTLRDAMEALLAAPISESEAAAYAEIGLDVDKIDRRVALALGLFKAAAAGNVEAYKVIAEMLGEKSQTINDIKREMQGREQIDKLIDSITSAV